VTLSFPGWQCENGGVNRLVLSLLFIGLPIAIGAGIPSDNSDSKARLETASQAWDATARVLLTVSSGEHGSVFPDGVFVSKANTSPTFSAHPEEGYIVDRWLVDGKVAQAGSNDYTIRFVLSDHTIHVTFRDPLREGLVQFNNRIVGAVDARAFLADGSGAGEGVTAQLYGAALGEVLQPLYPTTTFRTSNAAVRGYVNPVTVSVPGAAPGEHASIEMRWFIGRTYEDSTYRCESNPIEVTGAELKSAAFLAPNRLSDLQWRLVGSGDFNRDGKQDLLFQHENGNLKFWHMDGTKRVTGATILIGIPGAKEWKVTATGDFNSDGRIDLAVQRADGNLACWLLDERNGIRETRLLPDQPGDVQWKVVGSGDFNQDGNSDLVFQHLDGTVAVWLMETTRLLEVRLFDPVAPIDHEWHVAAVIDLNSDGSPDLVFQHARTMQLGVWFMNQERMISARLLMPSQPGGTWRVLAP